MEARLAVFREALEHFWPKPSGYPTKLIQVAGTSGKGSTCQFIQAGISKYAKSACYVKPHVFDYAERFVIDNKRAGHHEILTIWNEDVKPYCTRLALKGGAGQLDHPEVSLLIALHLFQKHGVEWAAIETGVGGKYDPVTTLEVEASVLTNVGRDHEDVLGSEHWQRALEKSGICRKGVPLVLGDDDPRTVEVISAVCKDVGAPLVRVGARDRSSLASVLRGSVGAVDEASMVLGAQHQLDNAALAAKAVITVIPRAELKEFAPRFLDTAYVGRFWKIEEGVYADVAHNPSKTEALSREIRSRFPDRKKIFVVGISGPRNPAEIVKPLVGQARAVVVTSAGYKGQDPETVYSLLREAFPALPIHLAAKPQATLKVAKNLRSGDEIIVFTGSTYMIDQALNQDERLRHLNGTYGWRDRRT